MHPPPAEPWMSGIELIYTIIVVFLCFAIYHCTKESYTLTKYKGIKFFRKAFLFFGLSYILRLLFGIIAFSTLASGLMLPWYAVLILFMLPMGYLSTMAIFYLIFSTAWKEWNMRAALITGHCLAAILTLISFFTRSHIILLYLQSIFLIIAIMIFLLQRKVSTMRMVYALISLFWLINLWVVGESRVFPFEVKAIIQIISIIVFVGFYYKVCKQIK